MRPIDLATPLGATWALLPEIILATAAMGVLLVVGWRHRSEQDSRLAGWLSLGALLVSGVGLMYVWTEGLSPIGLETMIAVDSFRYAASALFLLFSALTIVLSLGYLERERMLAPEYYCLILLCTAGMMFLGAAVDLIVVFLGLEVMSIAAYVLAGYDRRSIFSAEAGLKYFLVGAFASGFLLYGIALVYGATGTTNIFLIGAQFSGGQIPVLGLLGLGLLLIGFGFKVSAVPFHMWAPDVYDGAPTPVTGLMATGVKAAAFVALVRLLMQAFPGAESVWQPIIGTLAIATMVVGNLVALAQRSLKRMLAYSSVAHAGYLLVAVWPGSRAGAAALILYLLAYGLTTLATFGFLAALGRRGERDVTLQSIAGLSRNRPWMAFGLSVCMMSLLGFPGTFGFMAKWLVLSSVVLEQQWVLAVVLVLASVVSAGYYLPVVMSMYMKEPAGEDVHRDIYVPGPAMGVLVGAVGALLLFGVWPSGVIAVALRSALPLLERALTIAGS